MKLIIYRVKHMNLQITWTDSVSQISLENLKAINRHINFNIVILRDLCYYLIRKLCYPGENRAMPPRLRYFIYFLDFEMYGASRGRPCDSKASCFM